MVRVVTKRYSFKGAFKYGVVKRLENIRKSKICALFALIKSLLWCLVKYPF